MKKSPLLFLGLIFLLIFTSCASSKSLIIKDQWARPGNKGNNSAAYFVFDNKTKNNDKLVAVNSDIASSTEIHISLMQDGKMIMQQKEYIDIPANTKVEFKPKGLHVMFVDLKNDLKVEDQFNLTLVFENSEQKIISVIVKEQ